MADYSDDISKLLFDLDSQLEQTKRDIETSKKKSSEFEGFIEAFGSDGQSLSEKWEREEAEEKEYQEQLARERAEQQALLEEERKAEEARIKKERQRQLKAKKNATASEVKSLKEKWKREDAELKLEQQRRIQEAEYQLQLLREEQKSESEKQADAFGNFLSVLTGEAEQVSQEIQGVLEEADIQHIHEYSATNQMSEIGAAENLIADSVKAIDKLKREDVQEELSSDIDIAKLADRLDLLQKNLSELSAIGWGQRGLTYGSGAVRIQDLDDVEASAKTDGKVLTYQASTNSWIGGAGGGGVASGAVKGDILTLTMDDSTTVDIDIEQVGDMFLLLEDGFFIELEDGTGFVMGNHGPGVVVSGVVWGDMCGTLTLTHSDESTTDIDVTDLANVDYEPSGYHYVNDSTLKNIQNATVLGNGLYVEEGKWTKVDCNGFETNKLPAGNHLGIAGTIAWEGSGSKTYSRIWDRDRSRFYFDELPQDAIVSFRFKMDMIAETNNVLVQARINFFAIRDGGDDPVLEDATIVEEYRILLEDGDYVLDETDGDKIIFEIGVDMGQGDWPGAYNDTNYKIELETATTDDGTGLLCGDHFQAYNFQQTVAAQELGDGAGVEQERTFVFPVYVGDAHSQRGWGHFEVNSTADMIVNDSSVLAGLN